MKVNGILKKTVSCTLAALGLLMAAGCGKGAEPAGILKESNILEETVYLKGLEKGQEYELLFITDSHAVVRDGHAASHGDGEAAPGNSITVTGEAVSAYAEERYPQFCNGEGVDSRTQFEAYIRYANERKVDGVLLGGDIIDSPSEANLAWLAEQLGQLKMPYLYVPGNHDWTYPWEYMTEKGRQDYLSLLEPFTQGNTEISSLDFGDFVAVGVNDSTNQVSGEVFPEFERLCGQGKPMLVLAHVPFLTQSVLGHAREVWSSPVVIGGGNYGGIYPDENSARFVDMLTAADSPVELVLTGHVHFYDRDIIDGKKEVLQLTGAAGYAGSVMLLHVRGEGQSSR